MSLVGGRSVDAPVDPARAAMDDAFHAVAFRGLVHGADRLDVDLPIALVRQARLPKGPGDRVDDRDAPSRTLDRREIGDTAADDRVDVETERSELLLVSHEHHDAFAALEQLPRQRLTDEARCAGHENFHGQVRSPRTLRATRSLPARSHIIQVSGQRGMSLASFQPKSIYENDDAVFR